MSMPSPDPGTSFSASSSALLANYRPTPGVYDELVTADGEIRPRWHRFLEGFSAMSEEERARALATAQRMLSENGVTYVARGDPQRTSRPWHLDLFPMLIEQAEWQDLEGGLIQRARLLNKVLADLYGPQRLLKEKLLPPALVFGNPQFLRPCHGIDVPGETYLHFLAFDLARGADGRWWVLSSRGQAPSGAGYALENRIIASRTLPDLFSSSNVQRLASFFRSFSEALLKTSHRDEPLAVLLSPGPSAGTYFEHAYLARYLGYTVVEGFDLTVRDNRLFMKTVEGLKPVDLVMRRIDSQFCDPLELRTDSSVGVPGLLHAVRSGEVAIANALGSGLIENEALMSFMPVLSEFLLDEELELPSLATWWCGQPKERDFVLKHLENLTVREIFATKNILSPDQGSCYGPDLSREEAADLRRRIGQNGGNFIGQEIVSLSTAPSWSPEAGLQACPMMLRVYVAATADGYKVMPGGLTRVSANGQPRTPWLAPGDFSKDTWVLWDGPVDTFSLLGKQQGPQRLRRSGRDLPSRSADNLFWLGRYAERAEGAVRLLRSLVIRLSGEAGPSADPVALERLVSLLVLQEHLSQRQARRAKEEGLRAVEQELWTILFDPECPDGLAKVLGNVRRTAELVRERLSYDTWTIIKSMTDLVEDASSGEPRELEGGARLLNGMVQDLAAFNGMVLENMTRGYGWRFLDLGRRIERVRIAAKFIRHLTVRDERQADGSLALLLELADSTMTYRTRYMASPQLPAVLDLVLADDSNPRSALFQLAACEEHIGVLPQERPDGLMTPGLRILTGLRTDLRLADMERLAEVGRGGTRTNLDRLLRRLDNGVQELSDVVARTYFSHSLAQQVSGPQLSEAVT